jgi:hypothetical protein
MSWDTIVVFGGKNTDCILDSLVQARQVTLSKNKKTWQFCCFVFTLDALSQSYKPSDVIQAF